MVRRSRRQSSAAPINSKRALYIVGAIVVCIIAFTSIANVLRKSLFFANKDRVNTVFYGENTMYYSLGINSEGNYAIPFPADLKMQIPGGYGEYRVGALGKLVSLENKPVILKNSFSLATYSFIDYYFYPSSDEVYYGGNKEVVVPSAKTIWSSGSNAGILDRIYLILHFMNKKVQNFHKVPLHTEKNSVGEEVYAAGEFEKRITGYLFQQSYRSERKSVQIFYTNQYVNADRVGKMLEGNGIRIGDISQEGSLVRGCVIRESEGRPSVTGMMLVDTFGCKWEKGKTDIYDILFQLGEKEKEWEIKS